MKFDIARQPLVPAFLTLAALAVVAMWSAGGPAVSMAVQAGHAAGTVDIGRNAAGALAVSSPGELLAQFQAAHPVWARWIAGLLMLFTGMSVGRLTVRYNLYSVGTCLAIPLYEPFLAECERLGCPPQHGEFGASMQVSSENDGPVTLIVDTDDLK